MMVFCGFVGLGVSWNGKCEVGVVVLWRFLLVGVQGRGKTENVSGENRGCCVVSPPGVKLAN